MTSREDEYDYIPFAKAKYDYDPLLREALRVCNHLLKKHLGKNEIQA